MGTSWNGTIILGTDIHPFLFSHFTAPQLHSWETGSRWAGWGEVGCPSFLPMFPLKQKTETTPSCTPARQKLGWDLCQLLAAELLPKVTVHSTPFIQKASLERTLILEGRSECPGPTTVFLFFHTWKVLLLATGTAPAHPLFLSRRSLTSPDAFDGSTVDLWNLEDLASSKACLFHSHYRHTQNPACLHHGHPVQVYQVQLRNLKLSI